MQTDVAKISNAVRTGEFLENAVLKNAFAKARTNNSAVHLIGLLSDGDVHSSPENLFSLVRMAKKEGLEKVFIHAILDGRDVMPRTADIYTEALEIKLADIGVGKLATLCGRYYAMDREQNWERTARVYTMLVHAEGERAFDPVNAIRGSFLRGISDEFIAPIIIEESAGVPVATVKTGDVVVFFNHRGDRMRQLVKSLSVKDETDIASLNKPTSRNRLSDRIRPKFQSARRLSSRRRTECSGAGFRRKRRFKQPRNRNRKIRASDIFFQRRRRTRTSVRTSFADSFAENDQCRISAGNGFF